MTGVQTCALPISLVDKAGQEGGDGLDFPAAAFGERLHQPARRNGAAARPNLLHDREFGIGKPVHTVTPGLVTTACSNQIILQAVVDVNPVLEISGGICYNLLESYPDTESWNVHAA